MVAADVVVVSEHETLQMWRSITQEKRREGETVVPEATQRSLVSYPSHAQHAQSLATLFLLLHKEKRTFQQRQTNTFTKEMFLLLLFSMPSSSSSSSSMPSSFFFFAYSCAKSIESRGIAYIIIHNKVASSPSFLPAKATHLFSATHRQGFAILSSFFFSSTSSRFRIEKKKNGTETAEQQQQQSRLLFLSSFSMPSKAEDERQKASRKHQRKTYATGGCCCCCCCTPCYIYLQFPVRFCSVFVVVVVVVVVVLYTR